MSVVCATIEASADADSMPRAARVVAVGAPHHITQRGNNRQGVFLVDEDRRFYLETLREDSRRYGLRILGYCLMTNHVHLVAVPEGDNTLARAMQRTHSRYAQRFNRLYGRSGHLWQNRFFFLRTGSRSSGDGAGLCRP